MNKNQEKIKAALNRIEDCLQTINTDEDWLNYLAFQAKFYTYSARNAILIFSQNPEATFVKGFKAWNRLGRHVKKGAKGLAILAPCFKKVEEFAEPEDVSEYQDAEGEKVEKKVLSGFRMAYVFDIADTDGDDSRLPVLVKGLAGNSVEEQAIYEALKEYISAAHDVVEVAGMGVKGSYNKETGIICVKSDMECLQKIKTILHEYAHSIDFSMHPDESISRNRRELVAESVAFVVSLRLGLDTSRYSIGYIRSWLKDKDELKIVADAVQKVAAKIINGLAGCKSPAFSILEEDEKDE